MHLEERTPERNDAGNEQPTKENVNAALARLGLVRGLDITVKTLTHDDTHWTAETYESETGSTSLKDGERVTVEKSKKPETPEAVALKFWRAYGVEILENKDI